MEYFIKFGQSAPVAAKLKRVGTTLTVGYELNGSGYLLKIEEGKITHKTLGDGLDIEFVGGKRTVGRLKCGSSFAPYDVFCHKLSVVEDGQNKSVSLIFDDGDGIKEVHILLFAK